MAKANLLKAIKNAPVANKSSKKNTKKSIASKKAVKKSADKKAVAAHSAKKASERMTIAPDAKITKLVTTNPRREGTWGHESFAKIKTGMTVAKFVAAGGRRKDLQWDVKHGYLKVA